MNVTLIDHTGAGHADPLYAARLLVYTKATRLQQGAHTRSEIAKMDEADVIKELEYMANTIPSSWEFINYTFEVVDVTRACTQQMQRTRQASFAEQSQRVMDLSEFRTLIPESVKKANKGNRWIHLMMLTKTFYDEMRDSGVPAEDRRGVLPMNTLSSQIVKYNLRTFTELYGKRTSLRAQNEYANVVMKMREEILAVHPWADLFIAPDRTQTPFLDNLFTVALGGRPLTEAPEVAGAVKELEKLKGTH